VLADHAEDWAMPRPSEETLDFLAEILRLEQARLAKPGRGGGVASTLGRWRTTFRSQASELLLAYTLRVLDVPRHALAARPPLAGFNLAGGRLRGWRFGSPKDDGLLFAPKCRRPPIRGEGGEAGRGRRPSGRRIVTSAPADARLRLQRRRPARGPLRPGASG